jgi:transcription antitermination factor NusG
MNDIQDPHWFAIQTRSRHEKAVARQLAIRGCDCFLPMYQARRRWSDRVKVVELPLFEGYLFCRLHLTRAFHVLSTPGVVRIVGTESSPTSIPDSEIIALQRIVESRLLAEPFTGIREGQMVRIEYGSLAGVEGVVQAFRGRWRIIVSVTLLRRSVGVELDLDAVTPLGLDTVLSTHSTEQHDEQPNRRRFRA